jgi:MFS family permease
VFPSAVGFSSTLFEAAVITGPALGGVLYALGDAQLPIPGAAVVYGFALVLLLVTLTMFLLMAPRPVKQVPTTSAFSLHEIFEGLRFVVRHRPVLGAISLDLFAVLFGGATALLPVYASDILHTDPTGLGMLRAAPGVGAAITAGILATRPIERRAGRWMFGGVMMFGVSTVVFGLSTSLWLSIGALFLLGAGDMLSVFVRHLLVQLETPDEIRGRVGAVSAMFIGASNELGEFESGVTARWWGPVPAVVVGGVACVGVVLAYLWFFPELRRLDELKKRRDSAA